ncbi:hypothetical protein DP62_6188 [Burkholderia pseudomallei]|nr:hypothetical protein DP62_6188 [Burkholderia pseudomallei]
MVRGAIAGIVHGVTAAHSLSVIVGAVEGGACVQAHNVVRQSASSPSAHGGVFIDQSPQFVSIGRERRINAGARAVELLALCILRLGVGQQALDDGGARLRVAIRTARVVGRPVELRAQRAAVLTACDERDQREQRQPRHEAREVHAAALPVPAYFAYARSSFTSYRLIANSGPL